MLEFDFKYLEHEYTYVYVTDVELKKQASDYFQGKGVILDDDERVSLELKRQYFNPLLSVQDFLLLNDDFEVVSNFPARLFICMEYLPLIKNCLHSIESDLEQAVFENSIAFSITKNLEYMNNIINLNIEINPIIFEIADQLILNYENEILENLVAIITKKEVDQDISCLKKIQIDRKKSTDSKWESICKAINESNREDKNIIVIHLESISNEILNNHIHELPNVVGLMNQSLNFKNFIASASSSIMSLTDFFYGNELEIDNFTQFGDVYIKDSYAKNVFEILNQAGYKTLGLGCKPTPADDMNKCNLWNFDGQIYEWEKSYPVFLEKIEKFILENKNQKFGLHVWDLLTHLGHKDCYTNEGMTFHERMELSYYSLDEMVRLIVDALNKNNLLEKTVIVGYGDHGDEFFTRNINYGFSHSAEPYLNVVNTPSFIFDSRIEPFSYDGLVSLIDLKPAILKLTGVAYSEAFQNVGIDIFKQFNSVVYSRSMLANQREVEEIKSPKMMKLNNFSGIELRNKAYSIINNSYQLIVGRHGLEFFLRENDPSGYNNLLNFFEIENGRFIKILNHGAWRGNFRSVMLLEIQIFDMMKNFYELKEKLHKHILFKESHVNCPEKNKFDMSCFSKVRVRGFIWNK